MDTNVILNSSFLNKYAKSNNWWIFKNWKDIKYKLFKQLDFKKYDNIIILSSITNPKICQENKNLSNNINVNYTKNLIDECINNNKKIIFFRRITFSMVIKITLKMINQILLICMENKNLKLKII